MQSVKKLYSEQRHALGRLRNIRIDIPQGEAAEPELAQADFRVMPLAICRGVAMIEV